MSTEQIVRDYLQAVQDKDFTALDGLLADDFVASMAFAQEFNKAEWIGALRRLSTALERNDIRRLFVDGPEACVVYDFVTDTPVGPVPSVEMISTEDGRLTRTELIFEKGRWPEVMAEIGRRLAAVTG